MLNNIFNYSSRLSLINYLKKKFLYYHLTVIIVCITNLNNNFNTKVTFSKTEIAISTIIRHNLEVLKFDLVSF